MQCARQQTKAMPMPTEIFPTKAIMAAPDMERSQARSTIGGVMAQTMVFWEPSCGKTVARVAPTNTR